MKNLLFTSVLVVLSIRLFAIVPPVLHLPADEAINQMPDAELNWYAVSGVGSVSYDVQIDISDQFSNPVNYTVSITSQKGENLRFGQKYYWRVRATDQTGTSDWSGTFSFAVFNRLVLNKPDNGAIDKMPNTELSWKNNISNLALTGIDRFEVQIDTAYDWHPETQNVTTGSLNSVFFMNETKGWAVGATGTILKYENDSWNLDTIYMSNGGNISATTITQDLMSINNGVIVGLQGTFLEYMDSIWILKPIEVISGNDTTVSTDDLYSVYALSTDNVWAVGKSGKILHRDATMFWTQFASSVTKDLNSVTFVDENHGWAAGKGGTIVAYANNAWTTQASNVLKDFFGISFTDQDHGWVVGKTGTILFYDGSEWSPMQSNSINDLNAISMISPNEGWAAGKNGVLNYFDGTDWVEATSNSANTMNGIFALNSTYVWSVGIEGTIVSKVGEAFNSPLSEILSTPATNFKITTEFLRFNVRYYWRIRAIHPTDTSGWSPVRFFSTIAGVSLLLPDQNAVDQMPNANLSWSPITGIFNYIYQVCTDPNFTFPCITGFTQKTNITIPGLEFGKTYYWRVKAAHYTDTTDWAQERNFTIINTVYLLTPTQGAVAGLLPKLTWQRIDGADQYELRYFTEDMSFIDTVYADTTFFLVYKPLTPLTTYMWKVRAYRDGDTTNWSAAWSFSSTVPPGIEDFLNDNNISLYPNPANDKLNIEINIPGQPEIEVSLSDLLGREIINQRFILDQKSNLKTLDLNGISKGLYILKIHSGSASFSKKIIIDK